MSEKGVYEVVWPRGERAVGMVHYAKRLDNLEGKTICELWDGVYRGNEILPTIEKELTKLYPGIRFVGYKVFGSTLGGEAVKVLADLSDKLNKNNCDAVISCVGC